MCYNIRRKMKKKVQKKRKGREDGINEN